MMELECDEEYLVDKTANALDRIEKEARCDKNNTVTLTREQLLKVLTEGHHAYFKEIVKDLESQVSALLASRNKWMDTAADLRSEVEKLQKDINQKWVCSVCGSAEPKTASRSTAAVEKKSLSDSNKAVTLNEESAGVIDLTDEDFSSKAVPGSHPAPPPAAPKSQWAPANAKDLPPRPVLKCLLTESGISLNWNATLSDAHEPIAYFQLYSYQQTSASPSTSLWKKIGNVKALPLPMACTLSQFQSGNRYFFTVRAMDVHHRVGLFSNPASVNLSS